MIEEYVRTARPISSRTLVREYEMGLSSATVRNEMLALESHGLLKQPHTSAGRVPTDKGYRYYIEHSDLEELSDAEMNTIHRAFRIHSQYEFLQHFGRVVSQITHTLSLTGCGDEDALYRTGFSELLREPEFNDQEELTRLGSLLDTLDSGVKNVYHELLEEHDTSEETIFIGEENPMKEARGCAMTFLSWEHPRGFEGFCALVGPTRTDYKKHKALSKTLSLHTYERRRNKK